MKRVAVCIALLLAACLPAAGDDGGKFLGTWVEPHPTLGSNTGYTWKWAITRDASGFWARRYTKCTLNGQWVMEGGAMPANYSDRSLIVRGQMRECLSIDPQTGYLTGDGTCATRKPQPLVHRPGVWHPSGPLMQMRANGRREAGHKAILSHRPAKVQKKHRIANRSAGKRAARKSGH